MGHRSSEQKGLQRLKAGIVRYIEPSQLKARSDIDLGRQLILFNIIELFMCTLILCHNREATHSAH